MNLVALADVAPQAWRNGGGGTQELLAWPCASDWLLRVSVATLEKDGAFSDWSGHDRWFAVLQGTGVALTLPQGEVRLDPGSCALRFDGAASPYCRLLDGPTTDLNLMLRSEAGHGEMRRASAGSRVAAAAAWRGLYTADTLMLRRDDVHRLVHPGTLLWQADSHEAGWEVQTADARAWWLAWSPY